MPLAALSWRLRRAAVALSSGDVLNALAVLVGALSFATFLSLGLADLLRRLGPGGIDAGTASDVDRLTPVLGASLALACFCLAVPLARVAISSRHARRRASRDISQASGATGSALCYRPEIDGLRAVAVMAVLLYHVDIAAVPGGFVGVDIFFVISGYLIMSVLAADTREGRFSVAGFYERRIRRILPALLGMALFCCAGAALLFPPAEFARFGRSLTAMALFASNLLFCFEPQESAGYFATTGKPDLLLHSWSLAVEEQFYILLPIGFALLRRFDERVTVICLAGLAALSFAFSLWAVAAWPLGAFYLVSSRAWELLMGSLLALGVALPLSRPWMREAATGCGLGLILGAVFICTKAMPFPGALAFLPCLGAWLIIHGSATGPTIVGRLLSLPPLAWTGLISYSLYLWHWPITVLVKQLNMGRLTAIPTAFMILTSFMAAYFSYRFIERPFRGKHARLSRDQLFLAAFCSGAIVLLAGAVTAASGGLPQRFNPQTLALLTANRARIEDHVLDECQNWRTPVLQTSDIDFCPIGGGAGTAASRNILFWGDSHVAGLRPLVQLLHEEKALGSRGAIFAAAAGCPPALRLASHRADYHCMAFARLALDRALLPDIDTVFIGFSAWWRRIDGALCLGADDECQQPLPRGAAEDIFIEDLRTEATAIRAQGKRVILALPAPAYNRSVPEFQMNRIMLGRAYRPLAAIGLAASLKRDDYNSLRSRVAAVAAQTGARLFDPAASLCRDGDCLYERGQVSLYSDDNHLAVSQLGILHDELSAALR